MLLLHGHTQAIARQDPPLYKHLDPGNCLRCIQTLTLVIAVINVSGVSAPSETADPGTGVGERYARSTNIWGRTQGTCVVSLISTTVGILPSVLLTFAVCGCLHNSHTQFFAVCCFVGAHEDFANALGRRKFQFSAIQNSFVIDYSLYQPG